MQIALLRFLQERQFDRVGGTRTLRANVRIVAATNRNLEEEVRAGRFREDLFIPPQRLPASAAGSAGNPRRYSAPGPAHIRQLENEVNHALMLTDSEFLQPEDLPPAVTKKQPLENIHQTPLFS